MSASEAAAAGEQPGPRHDSAAELQDLRREQALRLSQLPLDVTDETTIEAAAMQAGSVVLPREPFVLSIKGKCSRNWGEHGSPDLLINASDILSIPHVIHPVAALLWVPIKFSIGL